MADISELLSRERLAGYAPARLRSGVIGLIGAGALGNNVAQNLSLSGLGELRVVDFDVIEPSNATRSPLFPRAAALAAKPRSKARELAHAVLGASYADAPVVRYARTRVEALGLGALLGCDAIVAAVDSFRARAWLSDASRLLGIPLVEGGFRGSSGQVSVYLNASPGAPCYRCLNPVAEGGVSCSLYARGVLARGGIPATQSIAALTAAYVTEAAIRLLHPEGSPLANKMVTFDVGTGRSSLLTLTADPECPGVHRTVGEFEAIQVSADEPALRIFEALPNLADPEIVLPAEYLAEAPCARCGTRVHIGKPEWAVTEPPACSRCAAPSDERSPAGLVTASRVRPNDAIARRACRKLGIAPMGVVEVVDRATGESHWVSLSGSLDSLFVMKRGERIASTPAPEFTPVERHSDTTTPLTDGEFDNSDATGAAPSA